MEERPTKIRKLSKSDDIANSSSTLSAPITETSESKDATSLPKDKPTDEPSTTPAEGGEEVPKLSKSQLKKLKKKEEWEAGKDWRKAKRKEKDKEKKARKAALAQAEKPEAGEQAGDVDGEPAENGPRPKRRHPVPVPVTLIIDCDFDELMTEKEIISMGQQLTRCYSDNRNAPFRSQMIVSSFNKSLKERFEKALYNTHLGWSTVKFTDKNFMAAAKEAQWFMESGQCGKIAGALLGERAAAADESAADEGKADLEKDTGAELAGLEHGQATEVPILPTGSDTDMKNETPPEQVTTQGVKKQKPVVPQEEDLPSPKIVYLTADSPNTLEKLEPNTSYIIGGIIDKNRHKGLCYKRACDFGVETAKLPIGEYMTMQSRTVLTTNHVVDIMLKWLEDGDWGKSFLRVIPKRKEAKLKKQKGELDEVANKDGDANGEAEAEGEGGEGEHEVENEEREEMKPTF